MRLPPAGRVPLLVCLLLLAPCCPSSKRRGQGRRCRKARTCEECTQMQAVCGWCGAAAASGGGKCMEKSNNPTGFWSEDLPQPSWVLSAATPHTPAPSLPSPTTGAPALD